MNDFEKYIKSQEKDFRLQPAPKVWEGVRRELDRKKKKRFFIIFFSGLLMVASGLLYIRQHDTFERSATNEEVIHQMQDDRSPESLNELKPIDTSEHFQQMQASGGSEVVLPSDKIKNSSIHLQATERNGIAAFTAAEDNVQNTKVLPIEEEIEMDTAGFITDSSELTVVKDSASVQKDSTEENDSLIHMQFSVGASFFAGVASHELRENTSLAAIATYRNRTAEKTITRMPSIFINYKPGKRFSISAGAGLQLIKESVSNSQLQYSTDTVFSPTSGIFTNYEVHTVIKNVLLDSSVKVSERLENEFAYLQIPLLVNYTFYEKGNSGFQLMIAASWMHLINAEYYRYDAGKGQYIKSEKEGLRKSNFTAGAGIAYNYKFSKKTAVFVSPSCHWLFDYITDDNSPLDQEVNYIGIAAGFQYMLK